MQMTKSIEELNEIAYPDIMGISQGSYRSAYVNGAKARDAQWLEVVNELRMKLKTCENDYWFMASLLERSTEKYVGDAAKDCIERMKFRKPLFDLIKADQMLKEMGIK